MATMIYDKIQESCGRGFVDGKPVYISPHQHWLIGAYQDLRHIAPKLRHEPDLLGQLHLPGGKIRFGLRKNDTFSTLSRLRSFRKQIQGQLPDVLPEHLLREFEDKRSRGHNGQLRLTDLYQAAQAWYERATLEVHHIVEKDLLNRLNLDKGELDPNKAPCVLIVAELHRRLFTPEGSKHREAVISASTSADAIQKLQECNTALYTAPEMSDILTVANIITHEKENT